MYTPRKFRPPDNESIKAFINEFSFASLISRYKERTIATHTPLFLREEEGRQYLIGHIAKANEQHHCFDGKQELLAMFMDPHCYISSSWYSKKDVPTWNYIAVHVYGTVDVIQEKEARTFLHDMVDLYEKTVPNPFSIDQISEEYFSVMLKAIVPFRMNITNIEATFKLSQNRSKEDFNHIIHQLEQRGDDHSAKIAQKMKEISKD